VTRPFLALQLPTLRRAIVVGAILAPVGALINGVIGFLYVSAGATAVAALVLAIEEWMRRRFRPAGGRSLPAFGFFAWGLLPTFYAILGLSSGPLRPAEVVLGAFVLAWWLVWALLIRGVMKAVIPAIALIAIPWSFAAVQSLRRVGFIIREGGMERADGYGSPALFLFNWLTELSVFLIPLTLIAARLVTARRGSRPYP
jgi:hypothetical protein